MYMGWDGGHEGPYEPKWRVRLNQYGVRLTFQIRLPAPGGAVKNYMGWDGGHEGPYEPKWRVRLNQDGVRLSGTQPTP